MGHPWPHLLHNVRRGTHGELAVEPFFPESAVREVHTWLFEDTVVRTAEAAVVLAASLLPVAGSNDGELAAWRQLLCEVHAAEALSRVRNSARRLLLGVTGGHSAYRDAKSAYLINLSFDDVLSAAADYEADPLDYAAASHLSGALGALKRDVEARPRAAVQVAAYRPDMLPSLVRGWLRWSSLRSKPVPHILNLVLALQEEPRPSRREKLPELDLSWLLPELADGGRHGDNEDLLPHVLASMLLSPVAETRQEAAGALRGVWRTLSLAASEASSSGSARAKRSLRAQRHMVEVMLEWVPHLPTYSDTSKDYFRLLMSLLGPEESGTLPRPEESPPGDGASRKPAKATSSSAKGPSRGRHVGLSPALRSSVSKEAVVRIIQALKEQNAQLFENPFHRAYKSLQSLAVFEGYFLEEDPVGPALDAAPPSPVPLDTVQAEVKYNHNAVLARLKTRYDVWGVQLTISDIRKSKYVRRLTIKYCCHPISELSELRARPSLLRNVVSLSLVPGQTEVTHALAVPILASAVVFEFTELWTNLGEQSGEVLQCPRCSNPVTDPHGICRYCRETAFQCRNCRNINYEHMDGFLCIECGHSRYGRFHFRLSATPSTDYPVVKTAEDYSNALGALDLECENLQTKRAALTTLHSALLDAVSGIGAPGPSPGPVSAIPRAPAPASAAAAGSAPRDAAAAAPAAGSASGGAGTSGTARASRLPPLNPASTQAQPAAAAAPPAVVSPSVVALASLYNEAIRPAHDAAVHAATAVESIRSALQQYSRRDPVSEGGPLPAPTLRPPVQNFRCSEFFVVETLRLLAAMFAANPRATLEACRLTGAVRELFTSNLKIRDAPTCKLLTALACQGDPSLQRELHSLIRDRVMYCLAHNRAIPVTNAVREEMALLADLAAAPRRAQAPAGTSAGPNPPTPPSGLPIIPMDVWQERVALALDLLLKATECAPNHPGICESVVLPCLRIILTLLGGGDNGRGNPVPTAGAASQAATPREGPSAQAGPAGSLPRGPASTTAQSPAAASPEEAASSSTGSAPTAKAVAGAINQLEEAAGPAVTLRDFQARRAGYEDYLRHRSRAALYISSSELVRTYLIAVRYGRLWRERARQQAAARSGAQGTAGPGVPILERTGLVAALLLNRVSEEVRSTTVVLLERICRQQEHLRFRLLDLLVSLLPFAACAGLASTQYFDLLCSTVAKSSLAAQHLSRRSALTMITCQLAAHVGLLLMADVQTLLLPSDADLFGVFSACFYAPSIRSAEALPHYAVQRMAELLGSVLDAPGAAAQFTKQGLLETGILVSAALYSLEVHRSKFTVAAEDALGAAVRQHWLASSEAGRRQLVQAGLRLARRLWDACTASPTADAVYSRLPACVLEQVGDAVHVEPQPTAYQLSLEKASSQEEYIPRYMPHNPYHSLEIGTLMRDVKKFICKELDLSGLDDSDDYCLELLVAGKIIHLSLPIRQVFEAVWLPSLRGSGAPGAGEPVIISGTRGEGDVVGPPMIITYRLPGLDGEATEQFVRELAVEVEEKLDPEVEFAVASELVEEDSLPLLVSQLAVDSVSYDAHEYNSILRLLDQAVNVQACRKALLKAGCLPELLKQARRNLAVAIEAVSSGGPPYAPEGPNTGYVLDYPEHHTSAYLEALLGVLEHLTADEAAGAGFVAPEETQAEVQALAEGLKGALVHGLSGVATALARLLPHLARGSPDVQAALLDHFGASLDLEALDREAQSAGTPGTQETDRGHELASFLRLAQSLDTAPDGGTGFRDLVLARGLPTQIGEYLTASFSELAPESTDASSTAASLPSTPWNEGLRSPEVGPGTGSLPEEMRSPGYLLGTPSPSPPDPGPGPPGYTTPPVSRSKLGPCGDRLGTPMTQKGSRRWAAALAKPGVALALQLLASFVQNHPDTANTLAAVEELLPLLHDMEGVTSGSTIAPLAEAVLEGVAKAGSPAVAETVKSLRSATASRRRELAARKRKETLAALGMQQVGGQDSRSIVAAVQGDLQRELEAIGEDREGPLACLVCKEGYLSNPEELLAAYCFCKRLPVAEAGGAAPLDSTVFDKVHSTVSHYNLIHVSCHVAARRADAALRVAKKEWEGASLRNGNTLANNLLPVKGPGVPEAAYAAAALVFWDNLGQAAGATPASRRSGGTSLPDNAGTRVSTVVADLALLLQRFALAMSFSEEAHGGGRESNARILPALLQLGLHFLASSGSAGSQGIQAALQQLMTWPPGAAPQSGRGHAPFLLAAALLLLPLPQWEAARRETLLQTLHRSGPAGPGPAPLAEVQASALPALRLWGLVDWLQRALKRGAPTSPPTAWSSRLEDLARMSELADEMLAFLAEMEEASCLEELFDIVGALSLALPEGGCDAFLLEACRAGP